MGVLSRMATVVKSKVNAAVEAVEDPRQTLEYSYQKQIDLLAQVKRNLADVVSSKKGLELQAARAQQQVAALEAQAKEALAAGREDLARSALERKAVFLAQAEQVAAQVGQLQAEQDKLTQAEQRLATRVEAFRTQKEVVKAQYDAAKATVHIGEAAGGLSREAGRVDAAVSRAQEKTDAMRSRAAAIDELTDSGVLSGGSGDDVAAELAKVKAKNQVESDLERLKSGNRSD